MPVDYFGLLCDLLRIPSVAPYEREMARAVYAFLAEQHRYDVLDLQEVSPERFNVVMSRGRPRVTFSTHLDTVPGDLSVTETADRISGRGACDAKGQLVAQLWAIAEAASRGLRDYACFFVVGEEVDSAGARAAVRHPHVGSPLLVNGEPTGNAFVRRSWGVAEITLRATGTERHSSLPDPASAIHRLIDDAARVIAFDDGLRVNVGSIAGGGFAPNVSAASASAALCVRFEGSSRDAIDRVRRALRFCQLTLRSGCIEPLEFQVPTGREQDSVTVTYCSDASHYRGRFDAMMLFGAGSIANAHTSDEHVDKRDLISAKNTLAELLLAHD